MEAAQVLNTHEIDDLPYTLPINLGLNDGTFCPKQCISVMQAHTSRTSLRHYTTAENEPLLEVIADKDGVKAENIYLANGSGPLLKQCIPYLIKEQIKSSPTRVLRHFINGRGFPIISGHLTYFKVPFKGMDSGLTIRLLPLGDDMKLQVADVEAELKKQDALVYICNPNNPTGRLMMERDEIEGLVKRFPKSIFWVDEAYVQYMPPELHQPVSDLVTKYDNLLVSRTFSFAYGLAGSRMGYLLAPAKMVETFKGQVTNYRFGTLQEALAIAALTDPDHLNELREITERDRNELMEVLRSFEGVEAYDSHTHFILVRFTDDRTGAWMAEELLKRGIKIKKFPGVQQYNYDEYFRITLGIRSENQYLIEQLKALLG